MLKYKADITLFEESYFPNLTGKESDMAKHIRDKVLGPTFTMTCKNNLDLRP